MEKKYQVFISSTYKDLIEQRNQVVETVLRLGHLPVGMEIFNAASTTPWDVIKSHIDNSDYYVVILAHRYGSEAPDGIGYTEKEYDYAVSRGIPCLGFVLREGTQWTPEFMEQKPAARKKLAAFKQKIQINHVSYWETTADLASQVLLALVDETRSKPGIGWIRANAITANPVVAEELSRLSKENSELLSRLAATPSQENDEFIELKRILSSVKFELIISNKPQHYTLSQLFLSVCATQAHPTTSAVFQELTGTDNTKGLDTSQFMNGLQELILLGLIVESNNSSSVRTWKLVDRGRQVYPKVRYADSSTV